MTRVNPKGEPTLHDVMDILVGMNGRMDNTDKTLRSMNERMDTVDERLGTIERRTGNIENKLEDVHDTLDAVAKAVDKDSVMLLNHDRRIAKLERV